MKKKLISFLCTAMAVLAVGYAAKADDLTVTVSTDNTYNYIKPVKAGGSREFKVEVINNRNVADTISIDKVLTFGTGLMDWMSVDSDQLILAKDGKGTFTIKVTIPTSISESEYSFYIMLKKLSYKVWKNCYTHGLVTKLLIDNTPPVISTVNTMNITSTSAKLAWSSSDSRSAVYTSTNTSTGFEGIETYSAILRDQSGSVYSWSEKATIYNQSHTFDNLKSNTEYTPIVSVTDMAGNVASFTGVKFITPPAAPTNLAATGTDYCSTTLTWNASAGATRYHVYNATKSPATEIGTTSGTSYRVVGLSAGAPSNYYVTAEGAGGVSPGSSVLPVTTLTVPKPIINAPIDVCPSGNTYTVVCSVTNLPEGCSVSWGKDPKLNLVSASGNTATFSCVEKGERSVTASIVSCGGASEVLSRAITFGIPTITGIHFISAKRDDGFWCDCNSGNMYTIYSDFGTNNSNYEIQVLNSTWTKILGNQTSGSAGLAPSFSHIPGFYRFRARVVSDCGVGAWFNSSIDVKDCSGDGGHEEYSIRPNFGVIVNACTTLSPNPANTIVAVNIANPNVGEGGFFSTVRIYNTLGQLVKEVIVEGCESSFSVADLSEGMYVVHVVSGDVKYKQKLQIVR